MATRHQNNDEGGEDVASDYIAEIFGKVKVTFSADDRYLGPIPLNDPQFVDDLQNNCGVSLKCESEYDKGVQKTTQFILEGTLGEINRAKTFLANWVKGGEACSDSQVSAGRDSIAGQTSRRHSERTGVGGSDYEGDQQQNPAIEGALDERNGRNGRSAAAVVITTDGQNNGRNRDTSTSRETLSYNESRHTSGYGANISDRNLQSRPGPGEPTSSEDGRITVVTKDGGRGTANPSSRHPVRSSSTGMPSVNGMEADENQNAHSGDLRRPKGQGRSDNPGRQENGLDEQEDRRHRNGRISPSTSQGDQLAGGSTTPKDPRQHPSNNRDGAVSESPDGQVESTSIQSPSGQENCNFVPVDAGVFAYILKMFGPNIKSLESRYNVKITADDVGVNESSMVKITPVGRSGNDSIREANEAVVDLYSTVFSTLKHREVQLEETSISSDALARVIADTERLYKEVLVNVSRNKLMIYGTKELDVKVVKAMVTNRVYDVSRGLGNTSQDRRDEERMTNDLLAERGLSTSAQGRFDHLAGSPPESQHLNSPGERTPLSTHGNEQYPPAGQQHFEELEENQHPEMTPRQPERDQRSDDDQNDTGQSSVPLKFRLKHDKLIYKTAEGLKVRVYQGDITKEKIGAIVNAANESLIHAGGVAGAIARAAGPMMTVDCTRYIAKRGLLYPAQVMWTSPGNLPCQFVIHAVGPRWGEYKNKAECYETLKTTFLRCLEVAEKELMVAAVAMPIISSGIFGVPISQCVDALYEAIAEFSKSWNPATHVLKEIRVLEIQEDSIKVIQGQLIGKLTGDGSGAVVRHIDAGSHSNPDDDAQIDGATGGHIVGITDDIGRGGASHYPADQYRTGATGLDGHGVGATSLSHLRALGQEHLGTSGLGHHGAGIEHRGATTSGLLDRPNKREVDDLFNANNSRKSHGGTLDPNLQDLMPQGITDDRLTGATNEGTRLEEIRRFTTDSSGKQKYSSLPNLRDRSYSDEVLPGNYRTTTGGASTLSKARPLSPGFDIDVGSRTSATLPASSGRLGNSSRGRRDSDSSTARPSSSYLGAEGGAAAMGATGGVGETDNESMIQSILTQHENGRQTAEQIDETQKLLNHLLAKDKAASSGRSREKEYGSSRRTQSLDRRNRKTKDKNFPLDTYDLHSDIRVKERDISEDQKCTVCFCRRELTQRKDCEHMTCRSCKRIGLDKGQCSLCKIKSKGQKAASSIPSSDRDQRSRSRAKKVAPDIKPLHGHSSYRVRSSATSAPTYRGGPVVALATTPPTSPELDSSEASATPRTTNYRLDPDGGATDPRLHTRDRNRDEYGGDRSGRDRQRRDVLPGNGNDRATIDAWTDSNIGSGNRDRVYSPENYKDPAVHGRSESGRSRSVGRRRDSDGGRETGGEGVGTGGGRGGVRQGSHSLAPPPQHRESRQQDIPVEGQTHEQPTRSGGRRERRREKGRKEEEDVAASSDGTCPICMDAMKDPKTFGECKHTFCAGCIDKAMKVKPVCPICGVLYGQLYGNQPAGTMTNYVEPTDLPGYEGCGTIVISYRFPDGVQSDDHANPGQPFRGTARMAYLPNNIEGQQVFRLLEKAFKSRLVFTIGQSVTTGEQNTVVWNDIHHKTRRTGGAESHGYPDPDYLRRVKDELSAKGIK